MTIAGDLSGNNARLYDVSVNRLWIGDVEMIGHIPGDVNAPTNTGTLTGNMVFNGDLSANGFFELNGDFSGNDAKFNDVSGVNFFATGGRFIGDLSGTVYKAAQPNITSVGTLDSLVVSGDFSGNDAKFNDVSGVNFFATGNFIGDLSGTVTAAQPNITSVGTLTGLVVDGDLSGNDASFNVVDIHTLNLTNNLSKNKVGLGNVDNESKATMFTNPTFTGTINLTNLRGVGGGTPQINIHESTILYANGGIVADGDDNLDWEGEAAARNNLFLFHTYTSATSTGWDLNQPGQNDRMAISAIGSIYASMYIIASDKRIKENIRDVSDNIALEKLRDISCCFYEYKDKFNKGNSTTIGFIAQQVSEHFPAAITLIKEIIPNEMRIIQNLQWTTITDELGNNTYKLTISDLSDACGNTKYRFYVNNDISGNVFKREIMSLENEPICFIFEEQWQNVFLYGKEVDDFHSLDKAKLFALNFSATQEIDKIQQAEKTKLAEQTSKLAEQTSKLAAAEAKITTLEAENTTLKARLDAIEAKLILL